MWEMSTPKMIYLTQYISLGDGYIAQGRIYCLQMSPILIYCLYIICKLGPVYPKLTILGVTLFLVWLGCQAGGDGRPDTGTACDTQTACDTRTACDKRS